MSISRSAPVQVQGYTNAYTQTPKYIGSDFRYISTGYYHSMAIKNDNTLWGWGANANALFGDGIDRSSPSQIGGSWTTVNTHALVTTGIKTDGTLWAWGANDSGQLGLGTVTSMSSPSQIGTSSWVSISSGYNHTLAIRSDNKLFAWGANDVGQLGTGDYFNSSSPVQIGNSSWAMVVAGGGYAASGYSGGITSDGQMFTWGGNNNGRLGYSDIVGQIRSWTMIAGNDDHTLAIDTNGKLFAWGLGTSGQLGTGDTISRSSPVQISTGSWIYVNANGVGGGNVSAAIRADNTLWVWGLNAGGQLGQNDLISRSSPTQVAGSWSKVGVGKSHMIGIDTNGMMFAWGLGTSGQVGFAESWTMVTGQAGIKNNGQLWVWGNNSNGELGLGVTTNRSSPVQVAGTWSYVNMGYGNSMLGIRTDGTLWTWGQNGFGTLGDGTTVNKSSPVQISGGGSWVMGSISGNSGPGAAIKIDGTLWAWGIYPGNNLIYRSAPVQVAGSYISVSAGSSAVAAIKTDKTLWVWGENGSGTLGQGDTLSRSNAVQIAGSWATVHAGAKIMFGIKTDGTLWSWGFNTQGQLGLGDVINRSIPAQVGLDNNWYSAGGQADFMFAVKTDGTAYAMGRNTTGELGINALVTGSYRSSPTQVASGLKFKNIAASAYGTPIAIENSILSRIFTWGAGSYGALADGSTVTRSSPVIVAGNPISRSSPVQISLESWTQVSAGDLSSYAIRNDGRLFSWGSHANGQLGTNDPITALRSSPTQIGTSSWTSVQATGAWAFAINSDSRLFAWGLGTSGQLGYNDTQSRSSPVQVSSNKWNQVAGYYGTAIDTLAVDTTGALWGWGSKTYKLLSEGGNTSFTYSWTQISAGNSHMVALRSDGRIYTWGNNVAGQLGDGTTLNRSSPTQIGATGNVSEYWYSISAGGNRTHAVRSDNTLWAWGLNDNNYILGDGSTTSRSSPVQIGVSYDAFKYSVSFDGNLDHLNIPSNAAFTIGSGSFTIEMWIYYSIPADTTERCLFNQYASNLFLQLNVNRLSIGLAGQFVTAAFTTPSFQVNTWYHIAVSRSGTTAYGFVNGVLMGSVTDSSTYPVGQANLGCLYDGTQQWVGYISNFRLTIGTGLYTSSFSPIIVPLTAAGAPLLLCQSSNVLANNGTTSVAITASGAPASSNTNQPFSVSWPTDVSYTQVYAGLSHTLISTNTSKLYAFGYNTYGQLGDSTTVNRPAPVLVNNSSWAQVSAGGSHSAALGIDGKLYAWGSNDAGQIAAGPAYEWSSVVMSGNSGSNNAYYLRNDGLLFALGDNSDGQLGQGDRTNRSNPTQVGSFSWIQVSAGTHTVVGIKSDYTLWSWGLNTTGQLGLGNIVTRSNPTQIGSSSWSFVNAGDSHVVAIDAVGKMYVWGLGTSGQLGQSDLVTRSSPVQIAGSWITAAAGISHTAAIAANSDLLFTWGSNAYGQLGNSTIINRSSPTQVGIKLWKSVSVTPTNTFAIDNLNNLYSFGLNTQGQLGLGDVVARSAPTQVGLGTWYSIYSNVGTNSIAGLNSSKNLFTWGLNGVTGQLGTGDTANKSSPTQIGTYSWTNVAVGYSSMTGITAQYSDLNTVWMWGSAGDIGIVARSSPVQVGTTITINSRSTPTQVGTNSWSVVSAGDKHTAAITSDYKLYVFGSNKSGQLGITSPSTLLNSNNQGLAYIRTGDGQAFVWGPNDVGQLGNNTTINRSAPIQISTFESYAVISRAKLTAAGHTLAIRSDGSLFAWGSNAAGKLGVGDTLNRSSPVQLSSDSWSQIATGASHSLAIKTDGTLWGWGLNTSGQAGTLSWSQVASGVSHTLVLRSDGQLFGWGTNASGQLGDGTTLSKSSPIQIGSGNIYTKVAAGNNISAAIRNDSTLWAWGDNSNGALGIGITLSRSSPVQVGAAYGTGYWSNISVYNHVIASSTDNRLFTWGLGTSGQLGTGDAITRSNPVQIGSGSRFSVYFNGSSGLQNTTDSIMNFGTGDFTVDCWIYWSDFASTQASGASYSILTNDTSAQSLQLYVYCSAPIIYIDIQIGTRTLPSPTGDTPAIPLNRWNHIAWVRKSGVVYMYLNGVPAGTKSFNYNLTATGAALGMPYLGNPYLGNLPTGTYISDFRIRRNYGVTPAAVPTSPITVDANTSLLIANTLSFNDSVSGVSFTSTGATPSLNSPDFSSSVINYSISAANNTMIVKNNSLIALGLNSTGQLGDGTTVNRSNPVQISGSWSQVSAGSGGYTLAINSDGNLYAWGKNDTGQLGLGLKGQPNQFNNTSSPVQVGSSSWTLISAGASSSMGKTIDGKVFVWGRNDAGQVGYVSAMSWSQVATGMALRSDSTLWTWSTNDVGSTGLSQTIQRSSPVQLGTSSWSKVFSSETAKFAITPASTLYVWGNNGNGQLGDGTTVSKSSPVQVAGSWSAVSSSSTGHTLGIKTDGTLWAWGLNYFGELGVNDQQVNKSRSSPVQVASGSWVSVSAGNNFSTAVNNLGQLYTWGGNNFGQLGTSVLLSWTQISSGLSHVVGIRNDGKLYAWGSNTTGQLGTGDTIYRSSPVQVGSGLGTYSAFFPGVSSTTTYVYTTTAIAALTLAASDFTIECWFYQTGKFTNFPTLICNYLQTYTTDSWNLGVDRNDAIGRINFSAFNGSVSLTGVTPIIKNQWYHVAVTRASGTITIWLNGVQEAQLTTYSTTVIDAAATSSAYIASPPNDMAGQAFTGYISNVRVIKGTSQYSSTFAVPTSPLTAVTNTVLLTLQYSYLKDASTNNSAFTTGNPAPTIYSFSPFGYSNVANSFSWTQVSAGNSHTVAMASDGTVWTWGSNTAGQLSTNDTVARSAPIQLGTSSWTQVKAGNENTFLIDSLSRAYSLGKNDLGALGVGDIVSRSVPTQISGSWTSIASSITQHTLAIASDNTLYAWGNNGSNELGTSSDAATKVIGVNRSAPVQISTSTWTKISAGYSFSAAIRSDGGLFTWGDNTSGQLGTLTQASYPATTALTGGRILRSDGKILTWGSQPYTGDGTALSRSAPVQLPGTNSWTQVSTYGNDSAFHTLAIKGDGTLWGWGGNGSLQLGLGDLLPRSTPVQIGSASDWAKIYAGRDRSHAIKTDGTLWAWGTNLSGVLGTGDALNRSSPVQITTVAASWSMLSQGFSHITAITTDGKLYAWGENQFGSFGTGDTFARSTPVQILAGSSFINTASGVKHNLSIRIDGALFGAGINAQGQLGDGTTINRSSPVQITTPLLSWTQVSAGFSNTMGIATTGALYGWGLNTSGALGQGNTTAKSVPTIISTPALSWTMISNQPSGSTGGTYYGLATTGALYGWGFNTNGQMGDGTIVAKSVPTLVAAPTLLVTIVKSPAQIGTSSWTQVNAGNQWTAGITTTGALFTWGTNTQGEQGATIAVTTTTRSSPVQVGTTSWVQVAGSGNPIAVTSTSGLFVWGRGNEGQIGDATTVTKSSPTVLSGSTATTGVLAGMRDTQNSPIQIGLSSYSQVVAGDYHTMAIASDKRLFTWGLNDAGQLGGTAAAGNTITRSSPVQVTTGGGSWNALAANRQFSVGLTSVNTLYVWGRGTEGQSGQLTTINRSSPSQIGTSSWTSIAAGAMSVSAVDVTNRLFAWGAGMNGQTALNDAVVRSSPVQVGTYWESIMSTPSPLINSAANVPESYGVLLNGTTDYVTVPATSALAFSTLDFTVECWFYLTKSPGLATSLTTAAVMDNSTANDAFGFCIGSDNILTYGPASVTVNPGNIPTASWTHIAFVRISGMFTVYLNGVNVGQIDASSVSYNSNNTHLFGVGSGSTTKFFPGFISNLRIVKGLGVYTGNFTVPTTALSATQSSGTNINAITNQTSLLLFKDTKFDDASVNNFPVTAVSGAAMYKLTTSFSQLSVGTSHANIIRGDGTLWNMGVNSDGRLGEGTTINRSYPVQIATATLYDTRSSPVQIDSGSWSLITAGQDYSAGIKTDGTLWTWGLSSTTGQLGDGTTVLSRILKQQIPGSWTTLSSGLSHTSAIDTSGIIWSWGLNNAGQLGNSDTNNRSAPVQLTSSSSWIQVSAGNSHTVALDTTNTPYAWGLGTSGQIGNNAATSVSTPALVSSIGSTFWDSVNAGPLNSMGSSNNKVYVWGAGTAGALGDGTTVSKSVPTLVATQAWTTTVKYKDSPTQILSERSWNTVSAAGSHTIAVGNDYTLWSWGSNSNGEANDGTTVNKSSPTQLGTGGLSVTFTSGGPSNQGYILNTGLILTNGLGTAGQLGTNAIISRSAAVQIFAGTMTAPNIPIKLAGASGYSFTSVQAGTTATAINNNSVLYVWGEASTGQLANNTTVTQSSPLIVGGLVATNTNSPVQLSGSWNMLSLGQNHSLAINSDNKLFGWGAGTQNGFSTDRSSPTQIGTKSWIAVSAGETSNSLALDSDNVLFAWGQNLSYQLGINTAHQGALRSSPVQIGTNISQMSAGGYYNGGFIKNN